MFLGTETSISGNQVAAFVSVMFPEDTNPEFFSTLRLSLYPKSFNIYVFCIINQNLKMFYIAWFDLLSVVLQNKRQFYNLKKGVTTLDHHIQVIKVQFMVTLYLRQYQTKQLSRKLD